MDLNLPPISDAERTPLVETLLGIIDLLCQRVHGLEETVQQLRDDNAVLKGQSPRPKIAPSRLTQPPPLSQPSDQKRPGSNKRSKNASFLTPIEVVLPFPDRPPGAVSNGYEDYFVQDLVLEAKVTRYLRERILLPDGSTRLASLPDDVLPGLHFGAGLVGFILNQHNQCNVTQGKLLEQLQDLGLDISEGELSRLLTDNHDDFHQEKAEILQAGLQSADYVGVDDTGARHQGKNGYCTALGNELFAYFESTNSKSRLNFLQVLRGLASGYTITEEAVAYWHRQQLAQALVEALQAGPCHFGEEAAWQAHLKALGITSERHVRIATEGALLGQVIAQGVSPNLVILSDGAEQFNVLAHAACWVHAERPLVRLIPYNDAHGAAIAGVRQQIWELYRDLQAYREQPDTAQKTVLEARFDALCEPRTGYPSINNVLKEMREHKADLLCVLDHPAVPLHNNGTESIIRVYVQKRKISGSTRSAAGRRCRDTFVSLMKTCRKLGISFWQYLQDRLRRHGHIARLAEVIRQRAAEARAARQAKAVPA
jgi:Transposase IS66 family